MMMHAVFSFSASFSFLLLQMSYSLAKVLTFKANGDHVHIYPQTRNVVDGMHTPTWTGELDKGVKNSSRVVILIG